MKFYESHYEEYIESMNKYDLHPEINSFISNLPKKINDVGNFIICGPSGVGKYSQFLKLIHKYSQTDLKYDKKITIQTEKQNYTYHISDIHYEIDMSLLGCNSKILWHEIFLQIVDIISINPDKCGFIVCKNMHMIHDELLQIFYSYIQQYSHQYSLIHIVFILISENISFLPNNIINSCQIINIKRPTKDQYEQMNLYKKEKNSIKPIINDTIIISKKNSNKNTKIILDKINMSDIINSKEIKSFSLIDNISDLPKDIFNIICDGIINEMLNPNNLSFTSFRDKIYDILIYNLDVSECICYIFYYFLQHYTFTPFCVENTQIETLPSLIYANNVGVLSDNDNSYQALEKCEGVNNEFLSQKDSSAILKKMHYFFKYYNNNYRPIYHLESILFYIIIKVHKL